MRATVGLPLLGCLLLSVSSPGVLSAQDCAQNCATVDEIFGPCESGCELCTSGAASEGCGLKTSLADHGIQFQANIADFYFGVVNGGVRRHFENSGHGDYLFNLDGHKLFGQEGLFIKVRAEHRFGETIGSSTGALLPATIASELPVADSDQLYLTNLLFTQFVNERMAVFFGKLDTLDGDVNAFAHGRGLRQFSNIAFVANPIALRTVPYSTLGMGFVIMNADRPEPLFTFSIVNPTDTANSSGFNELFAEGVALTAELRIPTQFFELPGHQLFAGTWSSRTYTALDQDPRIILPDVPLATTNGSWSLYWNFDQYLHVDADNPAQGWGVFGRAGIADDSNNPLGWFLSFGVGGNSRISGREADTFGLGWYYSGTSDEVAPFLTGLLGSLGDGQGVELFYNIAVTPNFHLTPDLQVIIPAREAIDPALVLGLRGVLTL